MGARFNLDQIGEPTLEHVLIWADFEEESNQDDRAEALRWVAESERWPFIYFIETGDPNATEEEKIKNGRLQFGWMAGVEKTKWEEETVRMKVSWVLPEQLHKYLGEGEPSMSNPRLLCFDSLSEAIEQLAEAYLDLKAFEDRSAIKHAAKSLPKDTGSLVKTIGSLDG